MKRRHIELVVAFVDALRRRDREAAAQCLEPQVVWQGIVHDLTCYGTRDVLDIFFGRREREFELERLEIIGTTRGAVFAFHHPEVWEVAGVEIRGAIYHAVTIEQGRITRIEDHADRGEAVADVDDIADVDG